MLVSSMFLLLTVFIDPAALAVATLNKLEMWANAKRDGRPAEYRWRPLFNAAKFG